MGTIESQPATAQAIATNGHACSRCAGVLDTTGYPLWCRKCRAENKRDYEATKKQMMESRGFATGVGAMREYLVKAFQEYGAASSFTGDEIASIIQRCKGPAAG
jgi:hypothetical protein